MYPETHQYITVLGSAYGGAEHWQFGFRINDGGASNQVVADALAVYVKDWWDGATPYATGGGIFASTTTHVLEGVKCARIQPDGTYPDTDPSYEHVYAPSDPGDITPKDAQLPQSTIAVTLTTAKPKGLASKGRIYLPPSSLYLPQSDGLITAANALQIAKSVQILINTINASSYVGNVMIYSKGKGVPTYNATRHRIEYSYPNTGASAAVTGVRVGRVVDTQRRRRRQLVESPQVVAL